MKKLTGLFLLGLLLVCSMGANCGWTKSYHDGQRVIVQQNVVNQPFYYPPVQLYPVLTQQVNWVPVVQNHWHYVPSVNSYYMNYGSYYNHQLYVPRYNADPWQGYNY